jgi:hypothetical protein
MMKLSVSLFGFFPVTGSDRRRCPLTRIKKNHMSNKAPL